MYYKELFLLFKEENEKVKDFIKRSKVLKIEKFDDTIFSILADIMYKEDILVVDVFRYRFLHGIPSKETTNRLHITVDEYNNLMWRVIEVLKGTVEKLNSGYKKLDIKDNDKFNTNRDFPIPEDELLINSKLSNRVINNLLRNTNIRTFGELCDLTARQFLFYRNLGESALVEVVEYLEKNGLSFKNGNPCANTVKNNISEKNNMRIFSVSRPEDKWHHCFEESVNLVTVVASNENRAKGIALSKYRDNLLDPEYMYEGVRKKDLVVTDITDLLQVEGTIVGASIFNIEN